MTGFELRTSGIRSDRSTNWATTTAQLSYLVISLECNVYLVVDVPRDGDHDQDVDEVANGVGHHEQWKQNGFHALRGLKRK